MLTCGLLDIPFAIKDSYDYRVGSTVRVTGCREGPESSSSVGDGPTDYKCREADDQHPLPYWEPAENWEDEDEEINRDLCRGEEGRIS